VTVGRERPPIKLVTVVIPAFDAEAVIGDQLAALTAQIYDGAWEVVVADNGSTDGTRAAAERFADRLPGLRVVDASAHRGPAFARNVGAAAGGGDLLMFCDADDVVQHGWLQAMVRAAGDADVVAGALDHERLNGPETRGWRGGWTTELPRPFQFLPAATSANIAVRREVWSAIGGWNDDLPTCEDVDFSWRAQLAGYELAFAPDAVVGYRHRGTVGEAAWQVYGYGRMNAQLLRRFRAQGLRRRSARTVARSYLYLVTRLPYVVISRRRRGFWAIEAAENLGRIAGSIRYRVFCP
jgi:glycosyltransferase involved in cell wall biosynthesis